MKSRFAKLAGPLTTIGTIAGAGYLLHRSLKDVRLVELWQALGDFPRHAVFEAMALTALSHLALTSYDYLGTRYVGKKIAYWRVALAAFIAYSISHSLGFPAVTGGAVRYRLYSRWGFNAVEVAAVMAMAGITLFLGAFLIAGVAMLFGGGRVEAWTALPSEAVNALGVVCLTVVAVYGTIGFIRHDAISVWGCRLVIPDPRFAALQIVLSGVDWVLVTSVLYVLMPHAEGISLTTFLGIFVVAYLLGTLSNVPGGLGVFESVILVAFGQSLPPEKIVSALLVYRGVYHLLPLALGGLLLLVTELHRRGAGPRPATLLAADGSERMTNRPVGT